MKDNSSTPVIERYGDFKESKFGIASNEDLVYIFDILRNKLYSDKIMAVVREYTTNAMDANIENDIVRMPLANLKKANARGGKNLSRYKLSPFFFLRHNTVKVSGQMAIFPLNEIKQLNPSITAKMNFKGLNVSNVQAFYAEMI